MYHHLNTQAGGEMFCIQSHRYSRQPHPTSAIYATSPQQLLDHELWCASSSVSEWAAKRQTFSRSLGASSILGYVLGLGDRHLDNILMDFSSGELLHIDYNICFDKVVDHLAWWISSLLSTFPLTPYIPPSGHA